MTEWSRKWWVGVGLRMAGLILLASAWREGRLLVALVHARAGGTMTIGAFLLAVATYWSASAGAALAIMGAALFDRIAISARWARNSFRQSDIE
jgi:predicted anti-sigma-YlaC factor YlaD